MAGRRERATPQHAGSQAASAAPAVRGRAVPAQWSSLQWSARRGSSPSPRVRGEPAHAARYLRAGASRATLGSRRAHSKSTGPAYVRRCCPPRASCRTRGGRAEGGEVSAPSSALRSLHVVVPRHKRRRLRICSAREGREVGCRGASAERQGRGGSTSFLSTRARDFTRRPSQGRHKFDHFRNTLPGVS